HGVEGLKRCYEENLRRALDAVRFLVEHLSGRVVVTSDHGELLGERGLYGHGAGSDEPILREVPWLVLDKGPRKQQYAKGDTEATEKSSEEVTEEEVKRKLSMLGYM
ncbi:MAG: hypothetical protein JW804_08215, partial [Sedimentisphaerales bacterium]|nr:hypothetical protein [Sedimentisphaerales bacterium]